MMNQKLEDLKYFLQRAADSSWRAAMNTSPYNPRPKPFGEYFEMTLQNRDHELSKLLDEIAIEQLKEQQTQPKPPDFTKYIRYSSTSLSHKEVFVGNKWVLVPADACVDFSPTTIGSGTNARAGFRVTISHEGNFAAFTSTESLKQHQDNQAMLAGQQLHIKQQNTYVSQEEFDWMRMAGQIYQYGEKNVNALDDAVTLYNKVPKEFKRTYAYKISKVTKAVGKPAKAGKIFQGTEKLVKKGSKIAKIGPYLSLGTIGYEIGDAIMNDTAIQPHTYVDGALLVIGVAATIYGAPLILTGIAIYGILDYAFDISEGLDNTFGSESGFWDEKPLRNFPVDRNPLFNEVKIDNTAVKKPFRISPKLKD